jgi:drug/metabolite transporter (DMT)-like permease
MLNRYRGEIYLITGALFFSFNGVISTLVLDHLSPFRLTQVRCIGAFAILFLIVASRNFQSLKATRREVPILVFLGRNFQLAFRQPARFSELNFRYRLLILM